MSIPVVIAAVLFIGIIYLIMNRVFNYLFLPLIIMICVGIILKVIGFDYVAQYVSASGSIFSACVALFIFKNNEFVAKNKEMLKRETKVEHLCTLIDEAIKVLSKEISNYNKFVFELNTKGLNQISLNSTPFYLIEQVSKMDNSELYDSIVKRRNGFDGNKLQKLYLDIVKYVENSLFIKKNSNEQYINFINSFNIYSDQWKKCQLDLNDLHIDINSNPSGLPDFDSGFLKIIYDYNQDINDNTINPYSIEDIRMHLYDPLVGHLKTNFVQHL